MVLNPRIKVGAAEVYLSGTVICRPGQLVEITPNPTIGAGAYRIQLAFVDNPLLPGRVDVANQPDNVVLVTITNFGANLSSTTAPLNVGQLSGTPLFLDIAGYTTGAGGSLVRVITYTVLQGRA